MALFYYVCKKCEVVTRRILDRPAGQVCPKCGKGMRRLPKPVTTKTNEVLDNGVMVNRVERLVDAEAIYKERSRRDAEENAPKVYVKL